MTAVLDAPEVADKVEHLYEPRGTAEKLLYCRDGEVLLSGPAGTGKSRACLEKLHFMALLNPGARFLMIRKTLVSLTSTGQVTYREHVATEALAAGDVKFFGGSKSEAAAYRYTNGSSIVVGGMDIAEKIMSSEYDVIYVQEATELRKDDWEKLTTRLRNGKVSFQQLMADCNPDTATHWLNRRCQSGQTTMLESKHEDNPVLYHADGSLTVKGAAYMAVLDNLTGVRYLRLRKGLWVAAEGMVYEGWSPVDHVIARFDIPDEWPRYWTVDFGHTNPFVCQWWARTPDDELIMYREIYMTGRLIEEHAVTMLEQVTEVVPDVDQVDREVTTALDLRKDITAGRRRWTEPKPRVIVTDHDAQGRGTLTKHLGFATKGAKKAIIDGINGVAVRLKRKASGFHGLYLMADSLVELDQSLLARELPVRTQDEFGGYVWDIGAGKATKELPVKENDHGMDASRYLVAEIDLGIRPGIRSMG